MAGLEFFPGYFGDEKNLYGSGSKSDNLTCSNVTRCIQNTIQMREMILAQKTQYTTGNNGAPAVTAAPLVPREFPNPWRADRDDHQPITFDQIPAGCTIKIFTVSGHLVKTLAAPSISVTWDMTNDKGAPVASGVYLYLVSATDGQTARGQLAIIR